MASRIPGFRRFSSASQQPPSPGVNSEDGSETLSTTRPATSGRSISSVSNLASSFGNRGPARSFVTQSPFANHGTSDECNSTTCSRCVTKSLLANPGTEAAQYSSSGVRQETAQLAAFAVADPDDIRDSTPTRRRTASVPNHNGMNYGRKNPQDEESNLADLRSGTHIKPPAIQEVSEPASPENTLPSSPTSRHVKPKRSNISEITKLFRTNSHSEHEPSKPSSSKGGDSIASDIPELVIDDADEPANENTPLLLKGTDDQAIHKTGWNGPGDLEGQPVRKRKGKIKEMQEFFGTVQHKGQSALYTISHPKSWDAKVIFEKGIKEPVGLLPCVFLGVLLNVLDALSYGRTCYGSEEKQRADLFRHDSVSTRRADFRKHWTGRHLNVLCQLYCIAAYLLLRRKCL